MPLPNGPLMQALMGLFVRYLPTLIERFLENLGKQPTGEGAPKPPTTPAGPGSTPGGIPSWPVRLGMHSPDVLEAAARKAIEDVLGM